MGDSLAEKLGRVLIVGGGHMGQAICGGLLRSAGLAAADVTVANPGGEKRARIRELYNCNTVSAGSTGLPADTIVLAVKPAVVEEVSRELAEAGIGTALVISVAAGVSCEKIESAFGAPVQVVRVMPNTPLECGQGMSAVSAGTHATRESCELVRDAFSAMGRATIVPESQLDIVTALSGSGPAYFELVAETLARSAEALGMEYATARELAVQTMLGTATLVDRTGADLASSIAAVSTPGGTTAAALCAMRDAGIEEALDAGLRAAEKRSRELGA